MKNKDSVRISVRLSEEEKEKLERSADICGLSQSEFVRQLCNGKTPINVNINMHKNYQIKMLN